MNGLAECANMRSGASGARQQLNGCERRLLRIVFRTDAVPAALLADMLAQQLVRFGMEDANVKRIPLDVDELSDPTWRYAVIGRLHFNASIHMHRAFAELVIP